MNPKTAEFLDFIHSFLQEFEAGQIEDEADYFDWYAFAKLRATWGKRQAAIHSAIH